MKLAIRMVLAAAVLAALAGCGGGGAGADGRADPAGERDVPGAGEADGAAEAADTLPEDARGDRDAASVDQTDAADPSEQSEQAETADAADTTDAAPDPAADEPAGPCSFARPPGTGALMLYYGTFRDGDTILSALTGRLAVSGLDATVEINSSNRFVAGNHRTCTPPPATVVAGGRTVTNEFPVFRGLGFRLAYTLEIDELVACLHDTTYVFTSPTTGETTRTPDVCGGTSGDGVEDTALFFEALVKDGWDYIAIDEITERFSSTPSTNFRHGTEGERLLLVLLHRLGALGLDRRMIFWFSPGRTDVTAPVPSSDVQLRGDNLYPYRSLFLECQDHCRMLVFETYGDAYLTTRNVVQRNADRHLDDLAERLHMIQYGTNRHAMPGIGTGPEYLDDDRCDIAPYRGTCTATYADGGGGLQNQLASIHAGSYSRYWWGLGFYKLGTVPARSPRGVYTMADLADFLAARTAWWATHSPP